jgi:hypothetical protein
MGEAVPYVIDILHATRAMCHVTMHYVSARCQVPYQVLCTMCRVPCAILHAPCAIRSCHAPCAMHCLPCPETPGQNPGRGPGPYHRCGPVVTTALNYVPCAE